MTRPILTLSEVLSLMRFAAEEPIKIGSARIVVFSEATAATLIESLAFFEQEHRDLAHRLAVARTIVQTLDPRTIINGDPS